MNLYCAVIERGNCVNVPCGEATKRECTRLRLRRILQKTSDGALRSVSLHRVRAAFRSYSTISDQLRSVPV